MKRLTSAIFFTVIFFLWNTTLVVAQFKEAGLQELKTPVNAPDFTLRELDGGEISLKELRKKVVVINFFTVD